ncbi:MAG: efflux RND transporter periplasmic adaptor subunit [candidate division NC10 bacterium]|nr:efflux RND transporter periplasmic adaptor subunit [candidate division NC10 bacterium]
MTQSSGRRLAIGLALLTLGLAACSRSGPADAQGKPGKAKEARIAITTAPVAAREIPRTVEVTGTLLPFEEVTLTNEQAGTVEALLVDLGDRVEPGQLLLRLDPQEARLALAQAEANLLAAERALGRARAAAEAARATVARAQAALEEARLNRKRFEDLFAEGAVSASQRDTARTQDEMAAATVWEAEAQAESEAQAVQTAAAAVEQARAALGLARKRAADTEVRSPLKGAVKQRLVSAGDGIKEKTPLLVLVATNPLKLQGTVPERFAPEIRIGQPVSVTLDAYPGRAFRGKVSRVSPAVDPQTRTLALEALLENPDGRLKPGFFAKGEVLARTDRDVPFAPEAALYTFVGITKVFVVADGMVQERQVEIGDRVNGWVEIRRGVKPGEVVATANLAALFDGAPVTVTGAAGAGGETR